MRNINAEYQKSQSPTESVSSDAVSLEATEEADAAPASSVTFENLPLDLTGQMLIDFEQSEQQGNLVNNATQGYRAAVHAGREELSPPSPPTHRM